MVSLDSMRWLTEKTLHAFDMARLVCREAANACNKAGVAKALASAKTVAAVERLAKADLNLRRRSSNGTSMTTR